MMPEVDVNDSDTIIAHIRDQCSRDAVHVALFVVKILQAGSCRNNHRI